MKLRRLAGRAVAAGLVLAAGAAAIVGITATPRRKKRTRLAC
jgi:hypothetical protein